jgi:hypothetical protein
MQLVRWEVRLLRAVPLRPLRVTTSVVRDGRRVQLVEAALHCEGVEVCRGTGLRIRVAEPPLELPAGDGTAPPPPGPDQARPPDREPQGTAFIETGVAQPHPPGRRPSGCGCATPWSRVRRPRR